MPVQPLEGGTAVAAVQVSVRGWWRLEFPERLKMLFPTDSGLILF